MLFSKKNRFPAASKPEDADNADVNAPAGHPVYVLPPNVGSLEPAGCEMQPGSMQVAETVASGGWTLQIFFLVSWLLTILVAAAPLFYFLVYGWSAREQEFLDKVNDNTPMDVYFQKFWSEGTHECRTRKHGRVTGHRAIFQARYRSLIGRDHYVPPLILFFIVIGVFSGLVVATAIRRGGDTYVLYMAGEAKAEHDALLKDQTMAHAIVPDRPAKAVLDAAFVPFPPIQLSLPALAAIAGGYLFVVAQLVQQCRARTLVYSDLFGASLRILVAVPMGLSVSALASDALGPFISFGLGAFPIGQLTMLIRRLTMKSLNAGDPRADDDQTVLMLGVTQTVTDVLAEENITCAQQLADIDPVVLAVRTGLSFDYVLFLAAQSMVWCFLGRTAIELGPLGLCDCRAIWNLMQQPTDRVDTILASAEKRFVAIATPQSPQAIDRELLRLAFEKIAADPYTIFLVNFTNGGKAVVT